MARSSALKEAVSEAIWGMVIADAVAMPVHWFYQIEEIKKRYNGWIQGNAFHQFPLLKIYESTLRVRNLASYELCVFELWVRVKLNRAPT